jgi:exopolyphosphatase/guanosine-5'-triphosphate,3'-diphosphate pyrophosphatase
MVVARSDARQLRIVDRIKEHVRLAEGLDGNGGLSRGREIARTTRSSASASAWRRSRASDVRAIATKPCARCAAAESS